MLSTGPEWSLPKRLLDLGSEMWVLSVWIYKNIFNNVTGVSCYT